jgi:hypothetical protein
VLERLLLRHLGPVDRDPLELEAAGAAVHGVAVVDGVVGQLAVAGGSDGGWRKL